MGSLPPIDQFILFLCFCAAGLMVYGFVSLVRDIDHIGADGDE